MMSRFAMLLITGCGLAYTALADTAVADCLGREPVVAAKTFYQQHADFYYVDPNKLTDVVTPRLLKVLAANYACSVDQECALDSDPWVDAQDGDIAEPVTFDLGDHTADQATVIVHYVFALSATEHEPQQVALKLQRVDQCWRVDDMTTPRGKSLVDEITDWFKINGDNPPAPDDSP
jgi:hypothetical protein